MNGEKMAFAQTSGISDDREIMNELMLDKDEGGVDKDHCNGGSVLKLSDKEISKLLALPVDMVSDDKDGSDIQKDFCDNNYQKMSNGLPGTKVSHPFCMVSFYHSLMIPAWSIQWPSR